MPRTPDPGHPSLLLFRHTSRRVLRTPLRDFLSRAVRLIAPGRAVTCLITTDQELLELNHRFRGKSYPTDVLSFPAVRTLGQPHASAWGFFEKVNDLGELAISFDRASEQAARQGHGIEEELQILILHGLLHLCGMNHETDSGEMARAERAWRKRLGLPVGLIERTRSSTA
jgi:probable rRNA maturation factor